MIHNSDSSLMAHSADTVHAVITDPPYGMGIMNNDWDKILPPIKVWRNCVRNLKPGGFLLAFGHTRFYHRLACQLEDCGLIIKDCLCWCYATGNPRPHNVDKAIDRAAGVKIDDSYPYEPKSAMGQQWRGWANTLKTAWEPIVIAQKPFDGSMVDNILKHKVGALNIDACRIPYASEEDKKSLESFLHFAEKNYGDSDYFSANAGGKKQANVHPAGRWPANLLWLDPMFADYDHIFMVPKPSRAEKGEYNDHDTVKPIQLMERLITLVTPRPSVVQEEVVVLDPFVGSGTTGIACKNLDRKFIGYEQDSHFFDIAKRRLKENRSKHFDLFER